MRALVSAVRGHIESEYADVWVEGEISNLRPSDAGHLYFTLKEANAQIKTVMFRSSARLLRFRPENGLQVVIRGRVTVYEDRGEMQISAEHMEPKGAGALQVAFEQLKAKLEAEGLFEAARKKLIPAMPRRIGVITSTQAAALRDILQILHRRHRTANVLILPVQVQGESCPSEVAAAIRAFNRMKNVEVIIVARGGGSLEDLAGFNNEGLARTVALSEIPVISAIGHETDFTIMDFVADLRAATPSAAAEMVIRSRQEIEESAEGLHNRVVRAMRYHLAIARQHVIEATQRGAFARMMDLINQRQQKIDELSFRIERTETSRLEACRRRWEGASAAIRHYDARRVLSGMRHELEARVASMATLARSLVLQRRGRIETLHGQIAALSPIAILDRGYALVFDSKGRLLKDPAQVSPGERIRARVAKGDIAARVDKE
ncbi:MAG TPA: exodeoxyribonuclease VII large subunit [Terriglobales bacterium]|nr:exodeoxyribonuclease VII large subunit [Terriglobales bacterium]